MALFEGRPEANVVDSLDEIGKASRETGIFLAKTCMRTFLERLYLMMSSVKEVLETGVASASGYMKLRASAMRVLKRNVDALERELANLDTRSDLDSTRVHVDEESLREWFNETELVQATRYIQTVLAEGPSTHFDSMLTIFSQKDRIDADEAEFVTETRIGSEFLLVKIFDKMFQSFASDRTFGLDAYLSRRIRHGTLSGNVMAPVNRILNQIVERVTQGDLDSDNCAPLGGRLEKISDYQA